MIVIRTEISGATEVVDRLQAAKPAMLGAIKTALEQWAEELASYIQKSKLSGNPIKAHTGALRDSVNPMAEQDGDVIAAGAGAGAGLDYAKFLEYGTRPHEIVPKRARFLRFEVDGRIVYAKRVNHPGNPAFHYMRDSLQEQRPSGVEAIRAAVAEALTT